MLIFTYDSLSKDAEERTNQTPTHPCINFMDAVSNLFGCSKVACVSIMVFWNGIATYDDSVSEWYFAR